MVRKVGRGKYSEVFEVRCCMQQCVGELGQQQQPQQQGAIASSSKHMPRHALRLSVRFSVAECAGAWPQVLPNCVAGAWCSAAPLTAPTHSTAALCAPHHAPPPCLAHNNAFLAHEWHCQIVSAGFLSCCTCSLRLSFRPHSCLGRVCGQQPALRDKDPQAGQEEKDPARDQDPAGVWCVSPAAVHVCIWVRGVGFRGWGWGGGCTTTAAPHQPWQCMSLRQPCDPFPLPQPLQTLLQPPGMLTAALLPAASCLPPPYPPKHPHRTCPTAPTSSSCWMWCVTPSPKHPAWCLSTSTTW